ncbi:MAG: DUF2062 domain-containing protein [Elusimicrobiota bacterium]
MIRRLIRKLSAIPESPQRIALAFAAGVFLGVMPGVGPAAALLVAFLFHLSKVATVLGVLATNSWTTALLYTLSYRFGLWSGQLEKPLEWRLVLSFEEGWHEELARVAPTVIFGGMLAALVLAGVSYLVARVAVTHYKEIRLHRQK